jgi:hypothetical protein
MSTKSTILISDYFDDSDPSSWHFSDKKPGAGYHKIKGGLHTATFILDNFKGNIKLQATLELYPSDADWFDIIYDNSADQLSAIDSTPLIPSATRNFTGNFLWIRAGIQLEEGTVTEIRYNY